MAGLCYCGRPSSASDCSSGWGAVSPTAAAPTGSSTRFRKCWRNGSSASRWATKTSTIMSNCGAIRCSGVLSGNAGFSAPLAGKSTLNRMELTPAGKPLEERYNKISYSAEAIDELLVTLFQEAHPQEPERIVLDLDATDMPLHGQQENRFFHGYYGHYCYLLLYIFCGDHLLCARLRPSNIDASAGSLEEVQRIVAQLRQRWSKTQIVLRADSGFCRDELMSWCEQQGVDYVLGFARNERLRARIEPQMQAARAEHQRTANRRGSSPSSSMRHAIAGAARGGWWPKRNNWWAKKIRASW